MQGSVAAQAGGSGFDPTTHTAQNSRDLKAQPTLETRWATHTGLDAEREKDEKTLKGG